MNRSLPFALLSAAALASGGMAIAQTPAKHGSAMHTTTQTTTKTTASKPAPKTVTTAASKTQTQQRTTATRGRMVTTKTATGKTVTYDCSKAGNAGKAACKR